VVHTPAEGILLAEADETIWEKLERRRVVELAEVVVAQVAAACARRLFDGHHFPRPPADLYLPALRLEHRTRLCLTREGFDEEPQRLGDYTLDEVLRIRSFGPRCLVDLLSALETFLARSHPLDAALTALAAQLAARPEAAAIPVGDPRFAPMLRELGLPGSTVREMAERLLARAQDPPDPAYVVEQLRRVDDEIAGMQRRTLEEEWTQIFASSPQSRNREIVISYYGWSDGARPTLAEIGARYGMTRERTRQICAKMVRRKDPAAILAPVTERALEFLAERLPCPVAAAERQIREAGLTTVGMRLEHVETGAKLLKRRVPFRIVSVGNKRLAVRPEQAAVPAAIVETAKKEMFYHGATTVERLLAILPPRHAVHADARLVVETLELTDAVVWLDRPTGWFCLQSMGRHGLPKIIQKALAVAGRLRMEDLQAAVGRSRRMGRTPLPAGALGEFCRRLPGVCLDGDWVWADPPTPWEQVLRGVEARLVRILREHGPVMERGALEELCVAAGINRFSFHAFIACSPVIAQYGHSIYGLIGAEVLPEAVETALARRRAARSPSKVLQDHGQTQDGRVWLGYRLSRAASTYAVVTVPSSLKHVIRGRFDLRSSDGERVGTLAAKDGRAWGLGAFLRRHGAQSDDYVVVTVDLEKREAIIDIRDRGSSL
jgi:hypothetical protein